MYLVEEIITNPTYALMPGLEVAHYKLFFETKDSHLKLDTPLWHSGFTLSNEKTEAVQSSVFCNACSLMLQNLPLSRDNTWHSLVARNKIWELWKDDTDRFVFTNPMQALYRQLVVDPAFTQGELLGDFSSDATLPGFPLPQDLEIVFFANWLAKYGDIILHASGVAVDGKGYAFVGPSGVGKSTLAGVLSSETGVTVLGEDQLVLRLIDNRFWIFGTPWHVNRSLCAPLGVPLERILFLDKKDEDTLSALTAMEGVTRLLQTAFIPYYRPELVDDILERLDTLANTVSLVHFSYLPGNGVLNRVIN